MRKFGSLENLFVFRVRSFALVVCLSLLFGLCACTVIPLMGSVHDELCSVQVRYIPEREGQYLRYLLKKEMGSGKAPARYELKINLVKTSKALGIGKDALSSRNRLSLIAHYKFIRKSDQVAIAKGEKIVYQSYSIRARHFYSDTIANDFTQKSNVEHLAPMLVCDVARILHAEKENPTRSNKKPKKDANQLEPYEDTKP